MIDGTKIFLAGAGLATVMLWTGGASASDSFLNSKTCPPYCDESGGVKSYGGRPEGQRPRPPSNPPGDHGNGGGDHAGGGNHGGHNGHGGHGGRKHWNRNPWPSYDYGWRPNYYVAPRYYYDDRMYYDDDYGSDYYDEPVVRARISCAVATRSLRHAGYRAIKATDCRGTTYSFRAVKDGKRYKVNVSARTGRIIGRVRV